MGDKSGQNEPPLTPDQRRVIAALMICSSVRKVAQRTKIHRMKIYRWMRKDRAFVAALDVASAAVFEVAMSQARAAASEAVATLRRLMRSKDEEIALKASREVIAAGFDADVALKAKHAGRNAEGLPGGH